jgi:nucleotide-binding universal stress UspA family protein
MKSPQKILIAYDGSKIADAALFDLRLAGLPAQCEAKVLTVADLWVPPVDMSSGSAEGWYAQAFATVRSQSQAALKQAKALAEKGASYLRAEFPKWKVSAHAVTDHPAQGLLDFAAKEKCDLIVLGSHGHGLLGRLLLGSVSLKVLNHAHCAVRIVRKKAALPTAPKLMVGLDGSRDSLAAVAAIGARQWPKGTKVQIVTAVDEKLRLTGASITRIAKPGKAVKGAAAKTSTAKGSVYRAEGWLGICLEKAVADLTQAGLSVSTTLVEGEARQLLREEVKRLKPHCVFLGSRGLGALERFILGSVSGDFVTHAPCTVEIVRPE